MHTFDTSVIDQVAEYMESAYNLGVEEGYPTDGSPKTYDYAFYVDCARRELAIAFEQVAEEARALGRVEGAYLAGVARGATVESLMDELTRA